MYKEVLLTEITTGVRVSDVLTIRTRNSVYEFFVIDPVRAFGLAKGGAIGNCAMEAFICQPTTLQPGFKAQLLLETVKGSRYITTSTIQAIKHFRAE